MIISGNNVGAKTVVEVTVVIPLFNKARHVGRAIQSVLTQTLRASEVIVVDDGSTDGGGGIVHGFSDPRIRLICQANAGVGAARNRGIREASFEHVAFLDADDEWCPCFLQSVVDLADRHPGAGMYATAYRFVRGAAGERPVFVDRSDQGGGLLDDYFRCALGAPPVCASAVMIPRSVFDDVGYFSTVLQRGEDLQMWARIAIRYPVAWSPVEGAAYDLSADSRASESRPLPQDIAAADVIERHIIAGVDPGSSFESMREYLVRGRLALALDLYLVGRKADARALLRKTRGTRAFRSKRRALVCALRIPRPALIALMALRQRILAPMALRKRESTLRKGEVAGGNR